MVWRRGWRDGLNCVASSSAMEITPQYAIKSALELYIGHGITEGINRTIRIT